MSTFLRGQVLKDSQGRGANRVPDARRDAVSLAGLFGRAVKPTALTLGKADQGSPSSWFVAPKL